MLIPEEEHDCARVVQLVHGLEVGDLIEVANVYHGKILDAVGHPACLISASWEGGGLRNRTCREPRPCACSPGRCRGRTG